MLKRIFEYKKEEVKGGWKQITIVRVIKSMSVRWVGHMAEVTYAYRILMKNPQGKKLHGRVILK